MEQYTIRALAEDGEEVRCQADDESLVRQYHWLMETARRPISIVPSFEPEGPAHSIYECGGYTFSTCGYGDCLLITTPSGEFLTESWEDLATILDKAGYGRRE